MSEAASIDARGAMRALAGALCVLFRDLDDHVALNATGLDEYSSDEIAAAALTLLSGMLAHVAESLDMSVIDVAEMWAFEVASRH